MRSACSRYHVAAASYRFDRSPQRRVHALLGRALGASHRAVRVGSDTIRRAATVHPICDVQIEYSVLSRGIENDIIGTCRELREATRPDPCLPAGRRMRAALDAQLDWIDVHALAYRAVMQGGISSDGEVHAIVERSRAEVVERPAQGFGLAHLTTQQRIICRGWVGFLEASSLEWLNTRCITKHELAELLETSLNALVPQIREQSKR